MRVKKMHYSFVAAREKQMKAVMVGMRIVYIFQNFWMEDSVLKLRCKLGG
jgi:hypothetical protein